MPAYVIHREPDGREVRMLYVPPRFPVRDHRIERADGRALILTPGQSEEIKVKGKKSEYRARPFTWLKDALHATRFTEEEARDHSLKFGIAGESRIVK